MERITTRSRSEIFQGKPKNVSSSLTSMTLMNSGHCALPAPSVCSGSKMVACLEHCGLIVITAFVLVSSEEPDRDLPQPTTNPPMATSAGFFMP